MHDWTNLFKIMALCVFSYKYKSVFVLSSFILEAVSISGFISSCKVNFPLCVCLADPLTGLQRDYSSGPKSGWCTKKSYLPSSINQSINPISRVVVDLTSLDETMDNGK